MCGIGAITGPRSTGDHQLVQEILSAIRHRGPPPWPVRSPEELYYFEIWREFFSQIESAYDLLDHEDPEAELVYSGFRVLADP
ncbi:MAG: hypothetical protein GY835_09680 [bacterium]|nr:hypothetical protein [bacterium]